VQQKRPTADAEPSTCTSARRFSSTPVIVPPTVTGEDTVEPYAGMSRVSVVSSVPATSQVLQSGFVT
jgi:hypothetical protein